MKIRIYCPFLPYPLSEGAFHVMFYQAQSLAKKHEVEIVTWKDSPEEFAKKEKAFRSIADFKVSIKSFNYGKTNLLGDRVKRVLVSLVSKAASPEMFYYPAELDLRKDLGPCDLAIYQYGFSYNWLKNLRPKNEKKIAIMFHNLESDLFEIRADGEKNWLARQIHLNNSRKLRINERAVAEIADEIWQISDVDLKKFKSLNPDFKTVQRVVPPIFDEKLFAIRSNAFTQNMGNMNPTVGFIGHLDFDPNRQSVEWILDKVAPLLKAQGFSGELLIGGRGTPDALIEKAKPYPFVRFLGFVQDLEGFMAKLDLSLVPHIQGSGVRIKLLEAIASGIPVLANSAAAERISQGLNSSPLLMVSDSPEAWADRIMKLQHRTEREKFKNLGIHPSLKGETVYAFLN